MVTYSVAVRHGDARCGKASLSGSHRIRLAADVGGTFTDVVLDTVNGFITSVVVTMLMLFPIQARCAALHGSHSINLCNY